MIKEVQIANTIIEDVVRNATPDGAKINNIVEGQHVREDETGVTIVMDLKIPMRSVNVILRSAQLQPQLEECPDSEL